jgi:signal transduction histidine kinase
VRHLSYTYHPAVLDDLGLEVALKRLVDDLSTRTGLHGTFQGMSVARTISQPVATCLYRIAQESLSNVVKHADASKFGIELNCSSEWITLAVTDDGKGFDPMSRKQERASLGLVSMKERTHLVKGELDVESTVGRGTLIRVRIPLSRVRP